MTDPIELLEERLKEIDEVKIIAEKNKLEGEEMEELRLMYDKYNVCANILKLALSEHFVLKGEIIKSSMGLFMKQERKIWELQNEIKNL